MKIILHGIVDLAGMAKAAERAMYYKSTHKDGTDKLKHMGVKVDEKFYGVSFNKASVSVWRNE